jgi:hypothetical protein
MEVIATWATVRVLLSETLAQAISALVERQEKMTRKVRPSVVVESDLEAKQSLIKKWVKEQSNMYVPKLMLLFHAEEVCEKMLVLAACFFVYANEYGNGTIVYRVAVQRTLIMCAVEMVENCLKARVLAIFGGFNLIDIKVYTDWGMLWAVFCLPCCSCFAFLSAEAANGIMPH